MQDNNNNSSNRDDVNDQLLLLDELTTEKEDPHDLDHIHKVTKWTSFRSNYLLLALYYFLSILSLGTLPLAAKWYPNIKLYMTHVSALNQCEATTILIESYSNGETVICPVQSITIVMDESRKQRLFAVISWLLVDYWVYAVVVIFMSSISAITSLINTRNNLLKIHKMAHQTCMVRRMISGRKFQLVDSSTLVPGDIIEIQTMDIPCDIILLSGECVVSESMLTGESVPIVKSGVSKSDKHTFCLEKHPTNVLFAGTEVLHVKTKHPHKVIGLCARTGFCTSRGKLILSILYPRKTQFKYYRDSFRFIVLLFLIGLIGVVYSGIRFIIMGVPIIEIILRCANHVTVAVPPALPLAITVCTSIAMARLKKRKVYTTSPPSINTAGRVDCMCFDKTGTLTSDSLNLLGIRPVAHNEFRYLIEPDAVFDSLNQDINDEELITKNKMFLYTMLTAHSLVVVEDEIIGDPLEVEIFKSAKGTLDDQIAEEIDGYSFSQRVTLNVRSEIFTSSLSDDSDDLIILKRFDFSSHLKRMAVIARDLKSNRNYVFVKGSPEHIKALCDKHTLPHQYRQTMHYYTQKGYRVIACAYKDLCGYNPSDIEQLQRQKAESSLVFLGLIVMCNKLKPRTSKVIRTLANANIFNIMVTGDNVLTAISVAKKCGIADRSKRIFLGDLDDNGLLEWCDVDSDLTLNPITLMINNHSAQASDNIYDHYELALTGPAFEYLYMQNQQTTRDSSVTVFNKILCLCTVYARMTPDQKRILCVELQKLDYYVGMCGDGSNDAPALKSAHVGISLSQTEASIAAPFTSMKPTIACVPTIILEGRASLTSSFQMFLYMGCYSLIQFFGVILLYDINSTFGDYQFLFGDLITDLPIALLMAGTLATTKLVEAKPLTTLIHFRVFTSFLFQLFSAFGVQMLVLYYLRKQSWYELLINFYTPDGEYINAPNNVMCFETTCLFLLSSFQYWRCAIAYSISRPFKKPLYTNKFYFSYLCILLLLIIYFCISPDPYIKWWLQLASLPKEFRFNLLLIALADVVLCISFERIVILGPMQRYSKYLTISRIKYYWKKLFSTVFRKGHMSSQEELLYAGSKKYNQVRRAIALDAKQSV